MGGEEGGTLAPGRNTTHPPTPTHTLPPSLFPVIILSVLEVIIILLLIFLRKRILIAIALIKEASRALGYVMCSILYPLVTFCLLCLCIAYWACTAVYPS